VGKKEGKRRPQSMKAHPSKKSERRLVGARSERIRDERSIEGPGGENEE